MRLTKVCSLFWVSFFVLQTLSSQSVPTWKSFDEIHTLFWKSPLHGNPFVTKTATTTIEWKEIANELSNSKIRSFEGRDAVRNLVALLSLSDQSVSATFFAEGKEYALTANAKGVFHVREQSSHFQCGCNEHACDLDHVKGTHAERKAPKRTAAAENQRFVPENGLSDNVLRTYRLAVAFGYLTAKQLHDDGQDPQLLFTQRANFLNAIYTPQLGIKFIPVLNDTLFNLDQQLEEGLLSRGGNTMPTREVLNNSTMFINKVIGVGAYDIGATVTASYGAGGMARLGGVYRSATKGHCTSYSSMESFAHEIGHLFGADHCYVYSTRIRNQEAENNRLEPGEGTSLMSYGLGQKRDFFNLGNILQIQDRLEKEVGFRINGVATNHTTPFFDNLPAGSYSSNRPPAISRINYEKSYTIPAKTAFRFEVEATDTNTNDELRYQVQQFNFYNPNVEGYDLSRYPGSQASKFAGTPIFEVSKHTLNNVFYFQNRYANADATTDIPATDYVADMMLMAYDFNEDSTHKTMMDTAHVRVTALAERTPFTLDYSPKKSTYQAGESITFTWNVDPATVPATDKVRIRLSADLGKTYPYILVNETENDGTETLTMPYLPVNHTKYKVYTYPDSVDIRAGVLMIEHIGGICYATSELRPVDLVNNDVLIGGFTIGAGTRTTNYNLSVNYPLHDSYGNLTTHLGNLRTVPLPSNGKKTYFLLINNDGVVCSIADENTKTEIADQLSANTAYQLCALVSEKELSEVKSDNLDQPITALRQAMYASAETDYITPAVSIKLIENTGSPITTIAATHRPQADYKIYRQHNHILFHTRHPLKNVSDIQLFSIDGKKVYSERLQPGNSLYSLEIPRIEKGVYIVYVCGSDFSFNEKIIF